MTHKEVSGLSFLERRRHPSFKLPPDVGCGVPRFAVVFIQIAAIILIIYVVLAILQHETRPAFPPELEAAYLHAEQNPIDEFAGLPGGAAFFGAAR